MLIKAVLLTNALNWADICFRKFSTIRLLNCCMLSPLITKLSLDNFSGVDPNVPPHLLYSILLMNFTLTLFSPQPTFLLSFLDINTPQIELTLPSMLPQSRSNSSSPRRSRSRPMTRTPKRKRSKMMRRLSKDLPKNLEISISSRSLNLHPLSLKRMIPPIGISTSSALFPTCADATIPSRRSLSLRSSLLQEKSSPHWLPQLPWSLEPLEWKSSKKFLIKK
jgi:hypothetical protein